MVNDRLEHVELFVQRRAVANGFAFIYLVECEGFVKIGVATNVQARVAGMQTGNPFQLRLLTSFQSDIPFEEEEAIHELLSSYHVRGEWFKLPDVMITHLLLGKPWKRLLGLPFDPDYSI